MTREIIRIGRPTHRTDAERVPLDRKEILGELVFEGEVWQMHRARETRMGRKIHTLELRASRMDG